MIIQIIAVVIFIIMLNKWTIKKMEKSEDLIERISYVILLAITDIYLIIYYFDRFNLLSMLGLDTNVNTQNWLIIITTCVSSIISSTIGGIIAFGIAKNQIKENNKQNIESLRIQNMPMLKYEIGTDCRENEALTDKDYINTIYLEQLYPIYDLSINIKNIGLNNIRRIMVDIESKVINKTYRILGKNSVIPIEKGEIKKIYKYLVLESGKDYTIKLNIYYEDVLQNWYKQVVEIYYTATTINDGTSQIGCLSYIVNTESLLTEQEKDMLFSENKDKI